MSESLQMLESILIRDNSYMVRKGNLQFNVPIGSYKGAKFILYMVVW